MSVYSDKAKETLDLLRANPEWNARYERYARKIIQNIELLKQRKASFHKWSPLYVYLTTSEMQSGGSVSFSLRYMGQKVGAMTVNDDVWCYPDNKNNQKYYAGYLEEFSAEFPQKFNWNSEEAKKFRKFFANNPARLDEKGKKNNEHRYESMLLTYFEQRDKKIEEFKRIRPVGVIPGARFPMPTPISASNKKAVSYSSGQGGGIDIFTRTGVGRATHLNIMELKDENRKGEDPRVVVKQAIAYATFILRLLRSGSGEEWYRIFGFASPLPDSIKVYATCLMPCGYCEDVSFAGQKIYVDKTEDRVSDTQLDNSDVIELHYMYFEECDGEVQEKKVKTSLK